MNKTKSSNDLLATKLDEKRRFSTLFSVVKPGSIRPKRSIKRSDAITSRKSKIKVR